MSSKLDYAEEQAVKEVRKAADTLEKILIDTHRKLDEASGKVEALEEYPLARALGNYSTYQGCTPSGEKAKLDAAWKDSQPIVARNQARIAVNLQIRSRFEALIQNAGIPTSYVQRKARSRWKSERVDAEWLTGFRAAIPAYDQWPQLESSYQSRLEDIKRWEARVESERHQEDAKKEMAKREVRRKAVVILLAEKYGAMEAEWDVRQAILAKDKYLKLAHHLKSTREDWSDGFGEARDAIREFDAQTPEELTMVRSLEHVCADCEDGREFRDCTWNYDRLFGIATERNPDAVADYTKLEEAAL